ncbi:MAG TPA: GNAT family N-acetyltransferase [Acidimicrobiia bacterium]|nr:GNAT family N-acetyltransferase [Acidimicrobiia bacterium]
MWRGIAHRLQLAGHMRIVIPEDRPKLEAALKDGAIVTLSPIVKTDREFFERGMEELSLESKFSRFGQGIGSLSAQELDYLTDVDQLRHVAWGAAVDGEVAGVGRYIVSDEDGCAEVAVTVLDALQHRGVGRLLFEALVAVARADGVHELCLETMADNAAVMRLVREVEVVPFGADDLVERRLRVSDLPRSPNDREVLGVIDEIRAARA